jgi:hypothetical protein
VARFIAYESGRSFLSVTPDSFNGIEEAIRWAEVEVPHKLPIVMNDLVHRMALVNQMFARKMSFGPYDPNERDSKAAWRLPVRRISQRYYLGWKVKQRGQGWWILYNDSREAFFIEFGISRVGASWAIAGQRQERLGHRRTPERRIRRPVRKLSLRKTMAYMMQTNAYHRVWCEIYGGPNGKGHHERGFTQHVQSPAMGSFLGPGAGFGRLPG